MTGVRLGAVGVVTGARVVRRAGPVEEVLHVAERRGVDYGTLLGGDTYEDPELYDEIVAFLGARRSDIAPTDWTPADIAKVLTHQVFIDPMLTTYQWDHQQTLQMNLPAGCVDPPDVLDCSETPAEADVVLAHVKKVATDPALFSQVLRADLSTVAWMYADARQGAYARKEFAGAAPVDAPAMVTTFGELEPGDVYYVFNSDDIHSSWDFGLPGFPDNEEHGRVSLRSMHDVPTMVTNGTYDLVFNAQFIPESMALYTDVLTSSVWNPTAPATAARPGQWELTYATGLPYGGGQLVVPMPAYAAGHSVSHHAPGELREDVQAFLAGTLGP